MAEKKLTMADDWGAPGAQATGAQVQQFLKEQITELRAMATSGSETLEEIARDIATLSEFRERINTLEHRIALLGGEARIAYFEKESGQLCVCPADDWAKIVSSQCVPAGVLVPVEGHEPLLLWYLVNSDTGWTDEQDPKLYSTNTANNITGTPSDYPKLFTDFYGDLRSAAIASQDPQERTAASQIVREMEITDAMGSGDRFGPPAGYWFMPSTGELFAIGKCMQSVIRCMDALAGYRQFPPSEPFAIWSSSERDATNAWTMIYDAEGTTGRKGAYFQYAHKSAPMYAVCVTWLNRLLS